jgi:hypothetical protein
VEPVEPPAPVDELPCGELLLACGNATDVETFGTVTFGRLGAVTSGSDGTVTVGVVTVGGFGTGSGTVIEGGGSDPSGPEPAVATPAIPSGIPSPIAPEATSTSRSVRDRHDHTGRGQRPCRFPGLDHRVIAAEIITLR